MLGVLAVPVNLRSGRQKITSASEDFVKVIKISYILIQIPTWTVN